MAQQRNATTGDERPKSRDFGPLKRLMGYLAAYKLQVVFAGIALIAAAGAVLSIGVGLRFVIDSGISSGNVDALDHSLNAIMIVIVVLAAATFLRSYLVTWLGERVIADLRTQVFKHLLSLSPGFFEVTRTGEVLSRLTADTAVVQTVIGASITQALRNVLLVIGGIALLLYTSPRLTGLVLLVVPLVILPIIILGRRVRKLSRDSQDKVADVGSQGEEAINAIRTVQAFAQEKHEAAGFSDASNSAFAAAAKRAFMRALLAAIVITLVFGAVVLVLWIGGHDVVTGRISAGELSSFVFFATIVATAVGGLSDIFGELQRAAGATERLFELLDSKPVIQSPAVPRSLPSRSVGRIAFERVNFRYPTKPDQAVLEGVNFTVEPGEMVAIVGPSGAGKSSIFQLLMRYYDPISGSIRFDGVPLNELDPTIYRDRIGLVPQEPMIFSTNAARNIAYGRPDASMAEIMAAAEAAAAHEFIEKLPEGYDTYLGEKGVRLSGGERQRIAIARAILKDPTVLLLDEATSALDSANERLVQDALVRLMQGRTSLVIAHRLATIVNAGRILVMDQGQIVEVGSHHELLEQGGLYARLANLQFKDRNLLKVV